MKPWHPFHFRGLLGFRRALNFVSFVPFVV
jgi:hypothetical protein